MLDEALFAILFDASLGIIQWVLILRFTYGIFLPENSRLLGVNHINKLTDPIISLFSFITHDLVIRRVRPLTAAFYILIIRFYVLPTIFGYDIDGMQSLSLEAFSLQLLEMIS